MIASTHDRIGIPDGNHRDLGRVYNPENELALIGIALAYPEAVSELRVIQPEWFCEPVHQVVWSAIRRAKPVCFTSVYDELIKIGRDDCVLTLRHAVDAAPGMALLTWHKDRLIDQFKRRMIREIATGIAEGDFSDNLDLAEARLSSAMRDIRTAQQPQRGPRSLADFARMEIDPSETLLGNRYLCRGGSMLFVGPSGVGKSSASCQQDMLWALGKPAFGIQPARPLRILSFQAENDDGDQHEMASGVMRGLNLTSQDMEVVHRNTRCLTQFETGSSFLQMMEYEVQSWRPDLVRIDPLNAFLGDDAKDPKAIASFCRRGINPILSRYGCGCVVAHHTPKTNFRDTSKWSVLDWAYAGAGGADLTNWARAVMVVDPVSLDDGLFRFIGAKRGARIGWTNSCGDRVFDSHFAYSKESGLIYWREAGDEEVQAARLVAKKVKPTFRDLLVWIPEFGTLIRKDDLRRKAMTELGIGEKKVNDLIHDLLKAKTAFEHKQKRSGKRDEVFVGRNPPLPGEE